MRGALCFCLIASGLAAEARVARIVGTEGSVEVRVHPLLNWRNALRNMPLVESSQVQTGSQSWVEIEFDEGSVLRLLSSSQAEISDYLRLSTGQKITHLAIDRGVAYFDGQPDWRDALVLSVPGAQVSPKNGSRVRVEVDSVSSRIAVIEGIVRVLNPSIEVEVPAGRTFQIDATHSDRFVLLPEVAELESDAWSRKRDLSLPLSFGASGLELQGTWIATTEFGSVWKPKVPEGWIPFRNGTWIWYDTLGFTWVPAEP
jgi:ferric-dicitrate binding protein FerR (iron transport regulator)